MNPTAHAHAIEMEKKSLCIAYLLWLCFGMFGAHHFYLRRTSQCFLWWSSLGGLFFIGWIRDLFRLPDYVADFNEDHEYMKKQASGSGQPRFSVSRAIGEICFGMFYSGLIGMAIPEGFPDFVHVILCPVASAFGVYMVGNIGREKGSYIPVLLTAYCGEVVVWVMQFNARAFWVSTLSTATFNWYREHDRVYSRQPFCKRLCMLLLGMVVVWSLWGSYFYFNCEVTTDDGEKIKLRDAISHVINSPAWREFWDTMGIVWQRLREQGFYESYKKVVELADFEGEQRASEILGVSKDAPDSEIKKAYKKLVLKYHPDKAKGEDSQNKFIEIQEAYERLMKVRRRKGRKSTSDEDSFSHDDL